MQRVISITFSCFEYFSRSIKRCGEYFVEEPADPPQNEIKMLIPSLSVGVHIVQLNFQICVP